MGTASVLNNLAFGLILLGAAFMALAGLGVATLPDVFMRLHANTKSATLGVGLILLGAATHFEWETAIAARMILLLLFIFATAPTAAHMIGRAAYFSEESPLWSETISDALAGNYDKLTHEVKSPAPKKSAKRTAAKSRAK